MYAVMKYLVVLRTSLIVQISTGKYVRKSRVIQTPPSTNMV